MSRRARGEGQIRHRADGRWEGRFTTPDGRRRSVFALTEDEVAKQLRDATISRDRGTLAAPTSETMTTYLRTWLSGAKSSLRPLTFVSYESLIRIQLEPRLGRIRLTQLRPQHIQGMVADILGEGFSPKYTRNACGLLHRAMDRAVQWHQLAINPCDGVDLPQLRRREMTALNPEQARAVLVAAQTDPLRAYWVLMLTTGLRQGELLALRWQDVDPRGGTPGRHRVLGAGDQAGARSSRNPGRGAHARRAEDTPEPSRRRARAARRRGLALASREHDGSQPGRPVFRRPDGRTLAVPRIYTNWRRLLRRADVPLVRPHDARHTCATLLLGQGVHPKLVSEMLGHSTVAITLDLYSHATAAMHREAASTLDALLRNVPG
jgi:integrase